VSSLQATEFSSANMAAALGIIMRSGINTMGLSNKR
jgi:hypothetical protein